MRKKPALLLIALAAIFLVSIPLLAHHGNAAYDISNPVSVKGTVTSFQFTNPHVMIFVESKNDKGEVECWVRFTVTSGIGDAAPIPTRDAPLLK